MKSAFVWPTASTPNTLSMKLLPITDAPPIATVTEKGLVVQLDTVKVRLDLLPLAPTLTLSSGIVLLLHSPLLPVFLWLYTSPSS